MLKLNYLDDRFFNGITHVGGRGNSMDELWIFLFSFLLTFLVCLLLLPPYIKKAKATGITGLDLHKPGSPAIAECGGVILILAYLMGLFVFIPFINEALSLEIIGAAATVLFASFIGFVDDIYETRWRIKVLTPLIGTVPLIVMRLGRTTMWTPIGFVDFGVFFYFLILPFIVTASANAVNMFAGLNGQEAGSSTIMATALLFLSVRLVKPLGSIILIPFLGALIGFLFYNRYPSRVFPGDIGTFGMGTAIACVAVLADLERAVFIMFIPHTINAILFFIGKLKGAAPPRDALMNPDGTLPAPTIWSLRSLIVRVHPMNEKTAIAVMLLIVALFALVGTLVYG